MGIFPDAQGQLAPPFVIRLRKISSSVEALWLSSLPAKMKKIRSKMKARVATRFPRYIGVEIPKSDIKAILAIPTRQRPYYNFVAKQQDSKKRYSVLQKGSPKCQGLCFTWGLHPKEPYPATFEDHEVLEQSREL